MDKYNLWINGRYHRTFRPNVPHHLPALDRPASLEPR
jgi:hypothetical protein